MSNIIEHRFAQRLEAVAAERISGADDLLLSRMQVLIDISRALGNATKSESMVEFAHTLEALALNLRDYPAWSDAGGYGRRMLDELMYEMSKNLVQTLYRNVHTI